MNWYAKAMDVVSTDQDWKAIVVKIAKKHPKMLVEAVSDDIYIEKYTHLLKAGEYIRAIKEYRTDHNSGLKEAKDFIDDLRDKVCL